MPQLPQKSKAFEYIKGEDEFEKFVTTMRSVDQSTDGLATRVEESLNKFVIKHEGEEQVYSTGMRRNTDKGKVNYRLIHLPFLTRFARHLTKGAEIHGKNNWKLASTREELERFEESAFRHLMQYLNGERDEDHAAAVVFNLMCAEYVKERIVENEQASSIR